MSTTTQDSAMMICYRECLSNMEKFNGVGEQKALQFINNIERIGKMINVDHDILYCMCTAKLDGEAKRWYENNMTITQWENLKSAFLERFTTSDSSSRIFEQIKERKQKPDETITSFYDAIIKLCHEYDPNMSQKMMISWLENGIKDSLKTQIKRQMKSLPESARTTQAFLKIAKDEQELHEETVHESGSTSVYMPYFTNTVSTTLQQKENIYSNASKHSYYPRKITPHEPENFQEQQKGTNIPKPPTSPIHYTSSQQHPVTFRPQSSTFRRNTKHGSLRNAASIDSSYISKRQVKPCLICQRHNHRTKDCYYKKPNGCYKCGQSDHRIRDCPKVFY